MPQITCFKANESWETGQEPDECRRQKSQRQECEKQEVIAAQSNRNETRLGDSGNKFWPDEFQAESGSLRSKPQKLRGGRLQELEPTWYPFALHLVGSQFCSGSIVGFPSVSDHSERKP